MKYFVTGVCGQLGHDVMNNLAERGYDGVGSDIQPQYSGADDGTAVTKMPYIPMDITDAEAVKRVIRVVQPDVVIHCAAWTAVDAAEDEENQPKVRAINVDGTQNIADACKELDCKMFYISTDYVFNGQGEKPWEPDCKDYAPLCVYGQTKLDGELAVANTLDKYFIVRIAWVFGTNGKNFIKTMLNVGKTHDRVTVVSDQIGTPTYTLDLSRLLVDMSETDKFGTYNATNEGYVSWADFAEYIFKVNNKNVLVNHLSTEEYLEMTGTVQAYRPRNSRLSKDKLEENGFDRLPSWEDATERYSLELKEKVLRR